MLEKAFDRLVRLNYNWRCQYPEIIVEIESTLATLRMWIDNYGMFCGTDVFNRAFGLQLETVGNMIADLITECTPVKGKKLIKKSRLIYQQQNIRKSVTRLWPFQNPFLVVRRIISIYLPAEQFIDKSHKIAYKKNFPFYLEVMLCIF